MQNSPVSQMVSNELYISNSQINTYLNCSLHYQLQYVEQIPPERISIALPFGSAIHAAVEFYFRSLKNNGRIEPLEALWLRFEDCLCFDLDNIDGPVIYKRDMPDRVSALEMGKKMLEAYYNSVDLADTEIIDVELPLSATLYTDAGEATEYKLFGVLDHILRYSSGEIVVVDVKTAARAISQSMADDDSQMTAYSYLVAANHFVPAKSDVQCRFDVLRKLKHPRFEQLSTVRTPFHRKRFAKMANQVLTAVSERIFFPRPSWRCADCGYQSACSAW